MSRTAVFLAIFGVSLLPSCQTVRFYGQAVGGQMEILRKSRANSRIIADPATSTGLRSQLETVDRIRDFATKHLSLPGDESYAKYADLGREHVVWVLYAAPEFSLKPKSWHYPLVGEMDYRGYFREQDTEALAGELKEDGYDVFIGEVDAYSTLGWFHDPVLNTFVDYPDIDLAETIFHELTHRKYFRRGDTVFNESFANVVAEEGVKRWLKHEGRLAELRKFEGRIVRRREFYREIDRARLRLEALYASDLPPAVKRGKKQEILVGLRDQFRELRRRWGGRGLEGWLREDINNGHIVSLNLYADQMPPFQKLLAGCGGDLDLFYRKVARLKLPPSPTNRSGSP
jgi:predicted aminopeptidase